MTSWSFETNFTRDQRNGCPSVDRRHGLAGPALVQPRGSADPVAAAFASGCRQRGLVVEPARGTALDGALALGRHLAQGHRLGARAPYLLVA